MTNIPLIYLISSIEYFLISVKYLVIFIKYSLKIFYLYIICNRVTWITVEVLTISLHIVKNKEIINSLYR